MPEIRLASELGPDKSRDEAFENFNASLESRRVEFALGVAQLALYDTTEDARAYKAVEDVLQAANNGTQIGLESPWHDNAWANILSDEGHRAAHARYLEAKRSGTEAEIKNALRDRGKQTLRVIAFMNLSDQEREQAVNRLAQDPEHILAA